MPIKTDKANQSIVALGATQGGKSTLLGHLMYKLRGIDDRAIEQYETESAAIGKPSYKYAWLLEGPGE